MKLKLTISTIAACALMSGAAIAEAPKNKKHNRDRAEAASVAGGVAAAGPRGAVAGGAAGSKATRDRSGRMSSRDVVCVPGTASTSTTGAAYTERRSGSAAINTNGTAAGSGAVSSSSEGEVYSSTDRNGSQADAYGNSTASAGVSRRC